MSGYADLIQRDRVHSTIFTSEDIYQAELTNIFYRYWVYVAHESEVPNPGDYAVKWIGEKQVIVSRRADGEIGIFFNRCRHRGATVCMDAYGSATFFRCPYHGWTYDSAGSLVGVPYPSRYGEGFDKSALGLARVPRVGTSSGFIFASLAEDGTTLEEHLGNAVGYLADFANGSPTGTVSLTAGASKSFFRGNWKFVGMDGYHTNFTHKTVLDLRQRKSGPSAARGAGNTDKSLNESWDLGNGHCRLDLTGRDKVEVGAASTTSIAAGIPDTDGGRTYMRLMDEAYGDESREVIRRSRDVHIHVWPNLQLIGPSIRTVRPLAAGRTEVICYPAMLDGVPEEINTARVRSFEWFNGVAGFGSPDDTEIFERNQIGLQADYRPWLVLARGLEAEPRGNGSSVGNVTDEVPQRAQMRAWKTAMSQAGPTNDADATGKEAGAADREVTR
ncbi:Rieske 2Fe-2S domain-containing protein [Streptomyces sp. NBC_01239]|uniref:aromatic ring-hydroxylating oxygenase subunit alpha n=1 Tax=Streptomyces sp. NBC_01239 TaxID=2903792 RepID=UPI002256BC86|nr:Rieske 2Fe-2S domain-containing protein [Streptomyces sp. NBC_01239]MCX4817984.1 Rieske 2Fe-2S domain-containing protein [Streptomyces sp. NBC_01239]